MRFRGPGKPAPDTQDPERVIARLPASRATLLPHVTPMKFELIVKAVVVAFLLGFFSSCVFCCAPACAAEVVDVR